MKTISSWGSYVTFKSIFDFWDILQHGFKKVEISALYEDYIKTTSTGGYYVTFKTISSFWDILEHDFKKGWNSCLVSKSHQAEDIT